MLSYVEPLIKASNPPSVLIISLFLNVTFKSVSAKNLIDGVYEDILAFVVIDVIVTDAVLDVNVILSYR